MLSTFWTPISHLEINKCAFKNQDLTGDISPGAREFTAQPGRAATAAEPGRSAAAAAAEHIAVSAK